MTTLSAMRGWRLRPEGGRPIGWRRAAIIGTLLAALSFVLGGCSSLRVAYHTGPQLAWWWADGYMDFTSEQSPQVKAAIERWFDWHRQTQLPVYASMLSTLQAQAEQPLTPAAVCQWNERIAQALGPAVLRALEPSAELLPRLGEAQLRHLEQRQKRNLDEARADYLQPDPAERRAAQLKRTVARAEQLYGRIDDAQRKLLADGLDASPFDAQAWIDERQRRQRDMVLTLRRLLAEKPDREQRLTALRALVDRGQRSPDPAYRAYQQRLNDYNCGLIARLHNATTPAQRQRARANLRGWEDDLRALIERSAAEPVPGPT